ncbi:hypothetical protein WJX77_001606 [Trebouxia sp. C0004]
MPAWRLYRSSRISGITWWSAIAFISDLVSTYDDGFDTEATSTFEATALYGLKGIKDRLCAHCQSCHQLKTLPHPAWRRDSYIGGCCGLCSHLDHQKTP